MDCGTQELILLLILGMLLGVLLTCKCCGPGVGLMVLIADILVLYVGAKLLG